MIDEGLGERQREVYRHVRRNFDSMMKETSVFLEMSSFERSITELFHFLRSSSCGSMLLQNLDGFDNCLMSHSTSTCCLFLLLGMKLERHLIEERQFKSARDAKDLTELGLEMLLHDGGKMRIPEKILNKTSKLTDEKMDEIRLHIVYGYEMVKGCVPRVVSQVVLNHHQRFKGGGYPPRVDHVTGEHMEAISGH